MYDNLCDNFLSQNTDVIIDLYYNIKESYTCDPFFLDKFESTHLTNVILYFLFDQSLDILHGHPNDTNGYTNRFQMNKQFTLFVDEYYLPIERTLSYLNSFLKSFGCQVSLEAWEVITFDFSYTKTLEYN